MPRAAERGAAAGAERGADFLRVRSLSISRRVSVFVTVKRTLSTLRPRVTGSHSTENPARRGVVVDFLQGWVDCFPLEVEPFP